MDLDVEALEALIEQEKKSEASSIKGKQPAENQRRSRSRSTDRRDSKQRS